MLKLQQQPTSDTCTSACIAMILGVDVNEIAKEIHDDLRAMKTNASIYLRQCGVDHEPCSSFDRIVDAGLYLLTVPSLNIKRINHNILYLVWPADNGVGFYHQIFDPNMGRDEKLFYRTVCDEDEKNSELIGGYVIDLKIEDWKRFVQ